jgi:hypothetical protein
LPFRVGVPEPDVIRKIATEADLDVEALARFYEDGRGVLDSAAIRGY